MARRLIHIQMIHSPADLGSVSKRLQTVGEETLTVAGWQKHQERVAEFWEMARAELLARLERELPQAPWDRLRIYQDGMPAGGDTAARIVDEVAAAGSPNYRLVQDLLARGARIEQTEDPRLLLEEYELARRLAAAQGPAERTPAVQAYRQRAEPLLAARDAFIAKRIDETLKPGELGVLFIGALHRVTDHLPADIEVLPLP